MLQLAWMRPFLRSTQQAENALEQPVVLTSVSAPSLQRHGETGRIYPKERLQRHAAINRLCPKIVGAVTVTRNCLKSDQVRHEIAVSPDGTVDVEADPQTEKYIQLEVVNKLCCD